MSYTKETGIPCAEGETVVRLDSGDLVAVQCTVARAPDTNQTLFMPAARWIDAQGATQVDAGSRNVATVKTLSMSPDDVTRLGTSVVTKECLLLVLGEALTADPANADLTIIPWSADIVSQCSIRNAIAAARVIAPAASDVL